MSELQLLGDLIAHQVQLRPGETAARALDRRSNRLGRGLVIEPLTMDPSEVGLFGYTTYRNGGAEAIKRGGQAMYQKMVASVI